MYKQKKHVKKYIWALNHEFFISLKSRNCFRYVLDNKIKGEILGWTLSTVNF